MVNINGSSDLHFIKTSIDFTGIIWSLRLVPDEIYSKTLTESSRLELSNKTSENNSALSAAEEKNSEPLNSRFTFVENFIRNLPKGVRTKFLVFQFTNLICSDQDSPEYYHGHILGKLPLKNRWATKIGSAQTRT